MNLRVDMSGKVKCLRHLAAVKASLNRANESDGGDAEPRDLHLPRMKSG